MKKLVLISVFFFACAKIEAGEGKYVKLQKGWGVTHALKSAGCKLGWTSSTMTLNGIPESKLRYLPMGMPVELPVGCSGIVPRDIAEVSRAIILRDHKRQKSNISPAVRAKTVSIKKVAVVPTVVESPVTLQELKELRKAVEDIRRGLEVAKPDPKQKVHIETPKKGFVSIATTIVAGAILLFGGLFTGWHYGRRKGQKEYTPLRDESESITHRGETYVFPLARIAPPSGNLGGPMVRQYRCCLWKAGCEVSDLHLGNLERHMLRAHNTVYNYREEEV